MEHDSSGKRRQSLTVFLLCALFFFVAMALALLGSGVYRSVNAASQHNYTLRTALSYLTNQVRGGDAAGGIQPIQFGAGDALQLVETDEEGFAYLTRLYLYDGWLRELYTPDDVELAPEDGTPLLELAALEITFADGLYTFTITDDTGETASISVAPRCAREDTL